MAAKTEFEPPKPTFSGRRPFSSDLSGGDYPTEDVDRSLRQNYREALESLGRKLHYACDPKTTGIEAPQRKYTKLLLTSVLVFALGPGTVTQAQTQKCALAFWGLVRDSGDAPSPGRIVGHRQ